MNQLVRLAKNAGHVIWNGVKLLADGMREDAVVFLCVIALAALLIVAVVTA